MAENHLGVCVCANLIFSSRFSHVSRLIPENTGYKKKNKCTGGKNIRGTVEADASSWEVSNLSFIHSLFHHHAPT